MADAPPPYVRTAMKSLTPKQKQIVLDGRIHGDVTMATVHALRRRALFNLHIASPNGRCGTLRLTPLGVKVQRLLARMAKP